MKELDNLCILQPVDMSFTAKSMAKEMEIVRENAIKMIKCVLPVGFVLKSGDSWVNVYKYDGNLKDKNDWIKFIDKQVLFQHKGNITIKDLATSQDIYKLCGLMQLISCCDITGLGEIEIYG